MIVMVFAFGFIWKNVWAAGGLGECYDFMECKFAEIMIASHEMFS